MLAHSREVVRTDVWAGSFLNRAVGKYRWMACRCCPTLAVVSDNGTSRRPIATELVPADGAVFSGRSFAALREARGEVVLDIGMVGYVETLTDPSYRGQIQHRDHPGFPRVCRQRLFCPVYPHFIEKVIAAENVDAVLLSFGEQTALNCGLALESSGLAFPFYEFGLCSCDFPGNRL
jgi:Carbamoyl-phosphate synthase small chain, CPSase domain